jgi:hypothetical protein
LEFQCNSPDEIHNDPPMIGTGKGGPILVGHAHWMLEMEMIMWQF